MNGDEHAPDSEWSACWNVHVMAHVYAARAVLPGMLARGHGYVLHTVSAAGLLTHPQSATYAVTKHASLAFAEWLSIAYGDRGIKVSALCPQGVRTDMLRRAEREGSNFLIDSALTPEQVAADVVRGLAEERFLILPHPEVAEYVRRRATDHQRWLRGMRKQRATIG
jgi:short-subunit dehydrogenase